jgi:orotidine-5'-phosphate decarboxylase
MHVRAGRSALLLHPVTGDESPVIFALDYPSLDEARRGAVAVRDVVGMLKVGLELFVECGPAAATLGSDAGRPVFLDLKLHDIPETVERAVARVCALGVRLLTVHAAGGPTMLARAAERAKREGTGLEIVAVTVLTSLDASDLARVGLSGSVADAARRLARLAFDAGVRTFVCSPHEVRAMRAELGPEAKLVTPGIRPASNEQGDDQKRIATPASAIRDGADWLVVGRPIRDAADPRAMAAEISRQAADARAGRRG